MAKEFIAGNRIAAVKQESNSGVFEDFETTDYNITFYDVPSVSFDTAPQRFGKPAVGKLTQGKSSSTQISAAGISMKTKLRHSGDPAVAPVLTKMFEIVGLRQIIVDDTAVGFQFDGTAPCKTASIIVSELNCGVNPSAIESKIRGASANMIIEGAGTGQEIAVTFDFSGAYENEADNASPVKVMTDEDEENDEKLLNTAFSIGGQAFILHNYNLNLNNAVTKIDDSNSNGGILKFKVTASDPILSCSLQKIDLATSKLHDDLIDDTVFNNITLAGKFWDIIIEEGNIRKVTKGEADSIITDELEIEIRKFKLVQKSIEVTEESSVSSVSSESSESSE